MTGVLGGWGELGFPANAHLRGCGEVRIEDGGASEASWRESACSGVGEDPPPRPAPRRAQEEPRSQSTYCEAVAVDFVMSPLSTPPPITILSGVGMDSFDRAQRSRRLGTQ